MPNIFRIGATQKKISASPFLPMEKVIKTTF